MCGILGIINIRSDTSGKLSTLNPKHIVKRGPDNLGCNLFSVGSTEFQLWHTRLAILDLSDRSNQPMEDLGSGWCIIYNGEIYNYIEIKAELEKSGELFATKTDTEVLLKAWIKWGLGCLSKLNGMFAFSVTNKNTGETFLIRDRFGVKPILWRKVGNNKIIFGSSITALAEYTKTKVDTNYCSSGLYYSAFENSSVRSPYIEVNYVQAGGWIRILTNNSTLSLTEGRWYNLSANLEATKERVSLMSDSEILDYCRVILEDSINLRLRSDVPIAISMSGGLDSSAIAAIACRKNLDLHGFTYGTPFDKKSEGPSVKFLASILDIPVHYVWVNRQKNALEELFDKTLEYQEAPFLSLSVMAQNAVFSKVREHGFKVTLGGQGGDEIFAGYRKFVLVALRNSLYKGNTISSLSLVYSLGLILISEAGSMLTYLRNLPRYRKSLNNTFKILNWQIDTMDLLGESKNDLTKRQVDDVLEWSIPTLLRYEDRNSMGHGIETRLPFMDYRLVELAITLPTRLKIRNGYGKWCLREMVDGIVPDKIRQVRRKRGFDVTQKWQAQELSKILKTRILDSRTKIKDFLKPGLNLEKVLSVDEKQFNERFLDELIMLSWLLKQ